MKKRRSDSSKCSAEPEDSGSALSLVGDRDKPGISIKKISGTIPANPMSDRQPFVLEDFYKGRKTRKTKLAPALRSGRMGLKVAPYIRAEHHNTDDVHFVDSGLQQSRGFETRKDKLSHALKGAGGGSSKNFVASGPMTTTNTHAKSTEKGSDQESSSRETSEISSQARYLNMNYLRRDFPVKLFPLRENARVFKTSQGELFSSKYAELLEVKELATYSLRMLKDYFLTTADARSQSYSFHWMSLGTMWNGKCLTLSIGCPRTVKGSLSSVLEDKVDEKYYLSNKMLEYIEKKTHHEVAISDSGELLKSPIRGQGDKPMLGYRWKPHDINKPAMAIDSNYYKGIDGKRPFILQIAQGKNRGGIKEKISPTVSASDFEHNNLLISDLKQVGNIDKKGHNSLWGRVYDPKGLAANINAEGGGLGAKTGLYAIVQRPRGKNKGGKKEKTSPSITASDFEHNNMVIANTIDQDGYLRRGTRDRDKDGKAVLTSIPKRRIRRLTPRECERLQGFPDDWTKECSDTQRYKMMGNAVSVPVITAIGEAILKTIK